MCIFNNLIDYSGFPNSPFSSPEKQAQPPGENNKVTTFLNLFY